MLALQVLLVIEQQIVKRPEFTLGCGRFRGLRRQFGMGVRRTLGEMAVHKPHLLAEMGVHDFHRRMRLAAGCAFKVAVFNHGHPRRCRTPDMVDGLIGPENPVR